MNTLFKTALITAVIAGAAAPAMAQDFGRGQQRGAYDQHSQYDQRQFDGQRGYEQGRSPGFVREGFDLFQRIDRLQDRVQRGRINGSINRREARRVMEQLTDVRSDLERATRGYHRLSPGEHARFEDRLERVGGMIRRVSDRDDRPYFRG